MGHPNASEAIRSARRLKAAAQERAGLNTTLAQFDLFIAETAARPYAGLPGNRLYWRLDISPKPAVELAQRIAITPNGLEPDYDAVLTGAYPLSLAGVEVLLSPQGEETLGSPILKAYPTPAAFRADIQSAVAFRLDGFIYQFRPGGQVQTDARQAEWVLRLARRP